MGSFAGKRAVVTGAGTGIGQRIAIELGKRGAAVAIHYHANAAGAEETARAIRESRGRAFLIQANLARFQECTRLIAFCASVLGGIDLLINNAALSPEAPFLDLSDELWNRVLATKLRAPFFCAQAAAREMIRQGRGGKIIHVGSAHGFATASHIGPYTASKGALHMLTKQMARELAPYRIAVNCVAQCPPDAGHEDTPFPEYDSEPTTHPLPWDHAGFPADIARVVTFLCSDEVGFLTGQVIRVESNQPPVQAKARADAPG
jgi:glucose 1-dehydrogenase